MCSLLRGGNNFFGFLYVFMYCARGCTVVVVGMRYSTRLWHDRQYSARATAKGCCGGFAKGQYLLLLFCCGRPQDYEKLYARSPRWRVSWVGEEPCSIVFNKQNMYNVYILYYCYYHRRVHICVMNIVWWLHMKERLLKFIKSVPSIATTTSPRPTDCTRGTCARIIYRYSRARHYIYIYYNIAPKICRRVGHTCGGGSYFFKPATSNGL